MQMWSKVKGRSALIDPRHDDDDDDNNQIYILLRFNAIAVALF